MFGGSTAPTSYSRPQTTSAPPRPQTTSAPPQSKGGSPSAPQMMPPTAMQQQQAYGSMMGQPMMTGQPMMMGQPRPQMPMAYGLPSQMQRFSNPQMMMQRMGYPQMQPQAYMPPMQSYRPQGFYPQQGGYPSGYTASPMAMVGMTAPATTNPTV